MRKLKFFFAMLVLLPLSIGSSWAAEETATFDYANTQWTTTAGAQSTTIDGITVSTTNGIKNETNSDFRSYANATLTISSSNTIKTIVFTYSNKNITAASVGTWTQTSKTWTGSASSIDFTQDGQVRFKNIVVTYEKAVTTDPTITVSPTAVDFGTILNDFGYAEESFTLKGENLTGNVNLEITGLFRIAATNYPNGLNALTVEPTDGAIDTTITIMAYKGSSGTFNKTLSITSEASEFDEVEMDLSLKVVSPVTSYDIDFEANLIEAYTNWDFVNIASATTTINAHGGTYYGNTGGKTTASITTKEKVALPGTLTFYISKESTNTTASSWVAQVSSDGSSWTDVETFDAKAMDKGVWNECTADLSEYSNVYVRISYGSSSAIRAIDDISLAMREAAEVEKPTIIGQTPFYPTTTVTMDIVTEDANIIYTIDGDDPTGGDNTYTEPLVLTETHTIKARGFKGVKLGEVVTKTFTKATPITVATAIEAIPNNNDVVDDAFVTGYVCTAGESVAGGQMTYYISADGTETNRLQVYKGKNLNNTDFSAVSDLAIGDKVVVYGQLKNYNGTPEMNSGNYIVEKVAKGDVSSIDLTGTNTKTVFEFGDHFDPLVDGNYVVKATYANGYKEEVTSLCSWDINGDDIATYEIQSEGSAALTATYSGKSKWVYIEVAKINKHKLTFSTPEHGTLVVKWLDSAIESGEEWVKTRAFTVVATPDAGYQLATLTANGVDISSTKAFTMGTEDITVAVEFTMVQEGVLVLSAKSFDWGTITAGTSPSSVPYKTFTLTGSNLTEGRTVTLTTPDWCHLTQTTANPTAGGNIATTNFYVYVNDATLETAGEYSGNIVISSDDLTADSLIAVSLNVVEATPSISVKDVYAQDITSIDFDNVDKGASVNQFSISMIGHHLTGDVKVTVANETSTNVFVTNGFRPSNTYSPEGGEIDAAVYVIPFTSTGGEFEGTITFHSESGDFDDIVIPLHINIKPDAGLEWSAATATAYTKGKPYELPTLTNPHDVTVAYSGNNDDVATVDAATGEVTIVAAGEVTITASFAGNDDYVAQEVEYTLTVKAPTGLRLSGEMITKEYEEGDHVSVDGYTVEAVFGSPYDYYDVTSEATWTLDGVDIATKTVTSTSQYTIEATWEGFTAWEYVNLVRKTHAVNFNDPEHGTLTVTVFGGTFISGAKFKKGTEVIISINPAVGYEGAVTVNGEPLVGNSYTIGTEDITIVATFNKVTIPAGLEWSATSADVRKGGSSNEFPTLTNPNSVEVTYESSDESIATINATTGAISLLANGSTTIKAVFAGNDDYFAQTVEYTLNVSAGIVTITPVAPVALELGNVPFGSTRADYGQSFHLNITNLISGQYNQVKIDFTGSAFWTAGNNYITDDNQDGVIDVDVTIVPSEFLWSRSEANALGEQNTTITLMCIGSAQFENVVVGTATMKVVESTPTAINNVEVEQQARKVIINDKMYIIRGEKMYDASGALVK
jgi:hypothetical protein